MIEVSSWTLLFWYLAGWCSPFLLLAIMRWRYKHPPKHEGWTAISNLEWGWEFDFEFKEKWTGNDIGIETARLMREQLLNKPLPGFEVNPGKYTVKLKVNAAFVKRD